MKVLNRPTEMTAIEMFDAPGVTPYVLYDASESRNEPLLLDRTSLDELQNWFLVAVHEQLRLKPGMYVIVVPHASTPAKLTRKDGSRIIPIAAFENLAWLYAIEDQEVCFEGFAKTTIHVVNGESLTLRC